MVTRTQTEAAPPKVQAPGDGSLLGSLWRPLLGGLWESELAFSGYGFGNVGEGSLLGGSWVDISGVKSTESYNWLERYVGHFSAY